MLDYLMSSFQGRTCPPAWWNPAMGSQNHLPVFGWQEQWTWICNMLIVVGKVIRLHNSLHWSANLKSVCYWRFSCWCTSDMPACQYIIIIVTITCTCSTLIMAKKNCYCSALLCDTTKPTTVDPFCSCKMRTIKFVDCSEMEVFQSIIQKTEIDLEPAMKQRRSF